MDCLLKQWKGRYQRICYYCWKNGSLYACLVSNGVMHGPVTLRCGIRQGGVLSPCLFAIYIDGLVKKVQSCGYGCYVCHACVSILLYADDILLLAPSALHFRCYCLYVRRWEGEGDRVTYNMSMPKKSARLRIGPRYNAKCKHDLQRGRNIMG